MKKLNCGTQIANKAYKVEVESAFIRALPGFSIVGLANQSIQESKDRIKSALSSIGFSFPAQKITINLSPSDIKKEGGHFDLSIAILIALQKEKCNFSNFFVFGELGLDGSIKSTNGIFALILNLAKEIKNLKVLIPKSQSQLIASIPNIKAYGVNSLQEAINFFKDEEFAKTCLCENEQSFLKNSINIQDKQYFITTKYELDFKEVIGQSRAKRAALIAAAGMHNILLVGSPGCGKSMILKRLRYILPPISLGELLEITALKDEVEFSALRPFRSPHHTSSRASVFGGGSNTMKPGEVALAHLGILFFDELPHFSKQILESLREPLEDKKVLISRVNTKIEYPTNFLFAAALNPCPCGYMLSIHHNCTCSELDIKRYKSKLSAPIMDRIDIKVKMDEDKNSENEYCSKNMQKAVLKAFKMQKNRAQNSYNSNLSDKDIKNHCKLNAQCELILNKAMIRYGLSQRSTNKILKISRTIADLDESKEIQKSHILEAIGLRG